MSDKNEKKWIFFEYYKNLDFIFVKVKKLIQAVFFKFRQINLLNSICQTPFNWTSPLILDITLYQIVILASIFLLSILQSMRFMKTTL